jgi:hypothetical protein
LWLQPGGAWRRLKTRRDRQNSFIRHGDLWGLALTGLFPPARHASFRRVTVWHSTCKGGGKLCLWTSLPFPQTDAYQPTIHSHRLGILPYGVVQSINFAYRFKATMKPGNCLKGVINHSIAAFARARYLTITCPVEFKR